MLPAQAPGAWITPGIAGVSDSDWRGPIAEADGFIWLVGSRTIRFDPRKPDAGAKPAQAPVIRPDPRWRVATRMPASNHDITAGVLNGKLYVAGGLTADFGFPVRPRSFDEVWELDPSQWTWRVAAKLSRNRVYCATAVIDGAVWVIGGDIFEPGGKRVAVTTVERVDPRTGAVTPGVSTSIARPMPIALVAGGRLYVIGNARDEYDKPGKIESIGPGESAWRPEPDGPTGMSALAGAALDDRLYVVVPEKGLAVYDTKRRVWQLVHPPSIPRSCQMTAYRGEIWMMGGVDNSNPRQTLIFDPRSGTFRDGPPLPVAIAWGAAAEVDGRLIVTGGAGQRSTTDPTYVYSDRTLVLQD
ncbi:MAG: hypothetical protein NTW19_17095 [Planctomycetota bacterium]|nr:hypothetical protein [Planctomycetota bacterium]